jgi:hypothetical protein
VIRLSFHVGRESVTGEPFPLLSRPFVGEAGLVGERGWVTRYYMIFLLRRSISVGVHR